MTVSMRTPAVAAELVAGPPCASCLFDLGDAAGMVGAGICPLKIAFLRRAADARRLGGARAGAPCDGFVPGYADSTEDWASDADADALSRRLC